MRILIACEFSGIVREAFAARGHDAWSCDLIPSEKPGNHYQNDVAGILGEGWDMLLAFPPCTHLASSGARYFSIKRMDGRQQKGRDFFMAMVNAPVNKICIENPVGVMSNFYRKPDQIIQPHHHGHAETKATCLWLKNLPLLQPTNKVEPDYMRRPDGSYYTDRKGRRYSRIHFLSGRQKDRARIRSITYSGVAAAMAAQWS